MISFKTYKGVTPEELAEQMVEDACSLIDEPEILKDVLRQRIETYLEHNGWKK